MSSIGIDIVTVSRFESWAAYPEERLAKIFSQAERAFLKKLKPSDRIEFLASRFAVKEAAYKALSSWIVQHGVVGESFSFRSSAVHFWVEKDPAWQTPLLKYDYDALCQLYGNVIPRFKAAVSLSHEATHACASVMLSPV